MIVYSPQIMPVYVNYFDDELNRSLSREHAHIQLA